jgi:pilus assembly protein Flp/PilA
MIDNLRSALVGLGTRLRREEGQALVEYALILGLISVVAITLLGLIGTDVSSILSKVESALQSAV